MTARAETVTILFTDLVGSTELLQRAGDEAAQRIFKAHHRLLREVVEAHGGHEVKWLGDGLMVAFDSAVDAVRGAIEMQRAARRPAAGERLHIRVGLNVGEALRDESDYFGTPVVVARRLCDSGDGGDIHASDLVARLLDERDEFSFNDLGDLALKGLTKPVHAWLVVYEHDPLTLLTQTPFVGRAAESAALRAKFNDVCAGRGAVAMLAGEPGIGKTRMIEEFSADARNEGARVFAGRCYEGDWAPPFSPFVEALREYVRESSLDALRGLRAGDLSVIARIVPHVRERLPDLEGPPALQADEERYRLLEAVSETIGRIAEGRPLVLVLDDLHWADKGTIAMLRHIARAAAAKPVLLLGAYRDVELDRQHPLAAALADLRRETAFERIALKGLAADEVGELLDVIGEQDVPRPLAGAIAAETNGNPFFIREVLLHLVEERKIFQEDRRWASKLSIAEMGIPEGVREVIGRRLSRLGASCNAMLTAASAMTGGFSWSELQAICEEPERTLVDALEEALRAQVLIEAASGRYDFTHALIRHTLYEELSTPRRLLLHRRIGEALEQAYAADLDAHLPELARHFYAAAPGGDVAKAVDYLRRAGSACYAAYGYEEATEYFKRALDALDLGPDDAHQRFACTRLLALAQSLTDVPSALTTSLRAVSMARSIADPHILAEAALAQEQIHGEANQVVGNDRDRWEFTLRLLEEALDQVGDEDNEMAVALLRAVAICAADGTGESWSRGLSASGSAVQRARRAGRPGLIAEALNTRHYVLTTSGGPAAINERVAVSAELATLPVDGLRLCVLGTQIPDCIVVGEMDRARALTREYATICESHRSPSAHRNLTEYRALLAAFDGAFDEAERLALELLSTGTPLERGRVVARSGIVLALVRRERGQLAGLEPTLRGFAAQYPSLPGWTFGLALLYAETGRPGEARAILERFGSDGFRSLPNDSNWIFGVALLSEVSALLADRASAAVLYELLLPFAEQNTVATTNVLSYGACSRVLGLLVATMQRWEEAEDHFKHALAFNTRMRTPPWIAYTQYNYACMLLARGREGDASRARLLLADATEITQQLGMTALQAKIAAARA